ncbi:hypothetical protein N8I77_002630 [Diaporthe amygdali]|uniref:NmrA-like domain-containing protein n=1 Tax=Phomopsis amygdali TaxID=1214568 RepID=A0AAD9SRA8_PHOAM|nr:hypothetical protein N8I77_002630 [Diaporthe amygdali]
MDAIAGGGGFAYILAGEIAQTANALLVLSNRQHPEFEALGAQVAVVDFTNVEELRYQLRGVDLVISTISEQSQLHLIDAAHRARVRTFVPSEFEGALARRPTASNDPLDRGSAQALSMLRELSQPQPPGAGPAMSFTVFSCGVLYERLSPGGLGIFNIGLGQNIAAQGDFLMDIGAATAEIVERNAQGAAVQVSMTSVYDVARFVAAAVEIGPEHWPRELRMRGDQLSVRDIVGAAMSARGVPFDLITREYSEIQAHLNYSMNTNDWRRWFYFQQLLATADGRYNLGRPNLNDLINETPGVNVVPERFADWLRRTWGQSQPQVQPEFQTTLMEID